MSSIKFHPSATLEDRNTASHLHREIQNGYKKPLDLHHLGYSLQFPGQAETPQCWCGQQNKPSAGRFDGPEITESRG